MKILNGLKKKFNPEIFLFFLRIIGYSFCKICFRRSGHTLVKKYTVFYRLCLHLCCKMWTPALSEHEVNSVSEQKEMEKHGKIRVLLEDER